MFERLLEFVRECWEYISFFVIVTEYQAGVVLRLGKWHRTIGPGVQFHWPLGYENVMLDTVVTDTHLLEPQSLTTKDGVSCGIRGLLTFKVRDVRKLLLTVERKENALEDSATGIIAECVSRANWEDLTKPGFLEDVQKAIRKRAFKHGIEVEDVQFPDLHKMRTYHVFQHHS